MHSKSLFGSAVKYSLPVMFGYLAIGAGFGLLLVDAGYPWWLAPLMCVIMYAGAAQYLAVSLFVGGAGFVEAALVQFALNCRHMAYGFSLFNRLQQSGKYKWYLIFSLSDETYALHASMEPALIASPDSPRFMFYVGALDQFYWTFGSAFGALLGSVLPIDTQGVGFALTALFIVLVLDQVKSLRKASPFAVAIVCSVLAVMFLPSRIVIVTALLVSLLIYAILFRRR
jgi:4-azaleucine resistance transporter AzlC